MIGLCVWALCVLDATSRSPYSFPQLSTPERLEEGKSFEHSLKPNESHSYELTLTAGQYFHVRFNFYGLDAAVRLIAPDGTISEELWSPDRRIYSRMRFMLVAQQTGVYRLEARLANTMTSPERTRPIVGPNRRQYYGADLGTYTVRLQERRSAVPADRFRGFAERAFLQGWRLRSEEDLPSVRQSLGKFAEAVPYWRASGDPFDEAYTLTFLGEAYQQISEYPVAVQTFEQALNVWKSIADSMGEPWTLSNLGSVSEMIGDGEKALQYYQRALDIYSSNGDARGKGICLTAIGGIYAGWGDKQKALTFLRRALPNWMAENVTDRPGQAQALNRMGSVLTALGDPAGAARFHGRALELAVEFRSDHLQAGSLQYLGRAHLSANLRQDAFKRVQQANEIQQKVGDRRGQAASLLLLGAIHQSEGRLEQAREYEQRALQLSIEIGDRSGEAAARRSLAVTLVASGDRIRAEDELQSALALHLQTGEREGEAATLFAIARLKHDNGRSPQALANIRRAIEIVEEIRIRVASLELRSLYLASVHEYYELYRDILMQLHRTDASAGHAERALVVNERAKARGLLDALDEAGVAIRQDTEPLLLKRERWLQQTMNEKALLRSQPALANNVAQVEDLSHQIEELSLQLREVQEMLRANSLRFVQLTPVPLVSVSTLQQEVLDRDSVLLEFGLGEPRSHLWAITTASFTSHDLPSRHEIEETTKQFYKLLSQVPEQSAPPTAKHGTHRPNQIGRHDSGPTTLHATAAWLSRTLLGPVASQIQGKRLIIIADGALQVLPFAALPVPTSVEIEVRSPTQRRSDAVWTPLVKSHELVYLPSASLLLPLRQQLSRRQPASKLIAVLADPVFEDSDPRVHKTTAVKRVGRSGTANTEFTGARRPVRKKAGTAGPQGNLYRTLVEDRNSDFPGSLSRLVFSRQEANTILSYAKPRQSRKALDFAASRSLAVSGELGQYRIVHFATHGVIDRTTPALSGIALSMVNQRGQTQDGFLRLHDIYRLQLPADLVVLSACNTALGKDIRGEGLTALTRGFMVAGAARVVASLWKVDDRATAELMKHFYAAMLQDGIPPSAALRSAQLALWQQDRWRDPRYWAAFQMQGEWR